MPKKKPIFLFLPLILCDLIFCDSNYFLYKCTKLSYRDLILLINKNRPEFELIVAPGPNEIEESKKLNARVILKDNKALTITQLAGLIDKAQFIISNDTGPAHMAAHLGAKGVTLFGYHTTPKKVSIETNKFKAIIKDDLKELSAEEVHSNISKELSLV